MRETAPNGDEPLLGCSSALLLLRACKREWQVPVELKSQPIALVIGDLVLLFLGLEPEHISAQEENRRANTSVRRSEVVLGCRRSAQSGSGSVSSICGGTTQLIRVRLGSDLSLFHQGYMGKYGTYRQKRRRWRSDWNYSFVGAVHDHCTVTSGGAHTCGLEGRAPVLRRQASATTLAACRKRQVTAAHPRRYTTRFALALRKISGVGRAVPHQHGPYHQRIKAMCKDADRVRIHQE